MEAAGVVINTRARELAWDLPSPIVPINATNNMVPAMNLVSPEETKNAISSQNSV